MDRLELAQTVGQLLKQQDLKIVTAESCTGGGLAYWITAIPGSSDWFDRGFVTYQNAAKSEMLDIDNTTLEQYGAVSEQIARAMAENALKKSHAQVSIAITGIAGPSGGTPEKPVGLVWLAWMLHEEILTQSYLFNGDRASIRDQAIECALKQLLSLLKSL